MTRKRWQWVFGGVMVLGLALLLAGLWPDTTPESGATPAAERTAVPSPAASSSRTAAPAATSPPFIPSRTATAALIPELSPSPTPSPSPEPATETATATYPAATFTPPSTAPAPPNAVDVPLPNRNGRFGVIGGNNQLFPAINAGLPIRTFSNWRVDPTQPLLPDIHFWHMVRLDRGRVRSEWADVDRVARQQPGAFWIIGNEPDVVVQDNCTPGQYATLYHDLYYHIKGIDPTARIAIAGVAQPTPLRRAYLDRALEAYRASYGEPMPIDIWTVHAFILREEAGSWGVGIPPGMSSEGARLYEIADHDDREIFQQNIIDFRAWMAARGYGDRPLAVTEYGVIMPNDYGFPPEAVASFMTDSFDFFLAAANDTGYAPDGGRLAQWWFWYSLYDDWVSTTGNLYDPETGELTYLGEVFADYVNGR